MYTSAVYFGITFILHLFGNGISRFYNAGTAGSQVCPCEDPRFCERIKNTTRKEIFVFSLNPKNDDWRFYDWNKITTVVMVGYLNMQVVCWAHKYGARAVTIGNVDTSILTNTSARAVWISKQLQLVKDYYLDGVNFDYEDAILQSQPELKDGYTKLVGETTAAFKNYDSSLMVTVDVAWSPDCIDLRCYDYIGLAKSSDFLFVMAYDEQSQIFGKCIAGANSGFPRAASGLQRFLDIGVPADQLVLGVPWYGYNYQCLALSTTNECTIIKVPFRGVNCSDAAGKQINYSEIIKLVKNSTTGRIWDRTTLSPYFIYKDPSSGNLHQVWYDDPQSLALKYEKAVDLNIRGVGMWNAECVDYLSTSPDEIIAVKEMWDAFPIYKQYASGRL